MGKYVRVVKAAGIRPAILGLKQLHATERRAVVDAERYLRHRRPEIWAKVSRCRRTPRVVPHAYLDRFKVRLLGCHVEPWCFACSREATNRRVNGVLERFHRATPKGQPMRFAHVVQTAAQTGDEDCWGRRAARDLSGFRFVVGRVLADIYGEGYGAYASYQDFGERAFGKLHPHLDLTLSGWTLGEQEPEQTQTYELRQGGFARWVQRTKDHAAARFLIHQDDVATNLNVQRFVTGARDYYPVLRYQLRQLIDVRKMTYDPHRGCLYWMSYRDNRREKMTLSEFEDGFAYYEARLGAFGHHQARNLHVGMGHLADARLKDTQKRMGGIEMQHSRTCICADCQDWGEPLYPDEAGEYAYNPWTDDGLGRQEARRFSSQTSQPELLA